ncbi:cytochrome P450 20A1-like [Patiria miniata]|uniref:Uncharacterized protein n=1 Tax=Patiria miniata TaxID=46514 RepID=A0A914BTK4_PATMI|nr:cytochrome P450 20A1-like [Patiria miniata]
MIQHRRDNPCFLEYQTFIDALLEDELPEEQMHDDCVGYLIGGLQTVGILTSWALYFLAISPDCQEKLYLNVIEAVGQGDVEDMNHEDLRYVGQVIKETLRLSVLSTYISRYHDDDFELAGHVLKAGTTTVHAIGVVMEDPVLWPDPSKFDPE